MPVLNNNGRVFEPLKLVDRFKPINKSSLKLQTFQAARKENNIERSYKATDTDVEALK